MLYAASKAAISKELGDVCFVDSLYATTPNDLTLDAYHRHRASKTADKPLTEKEAELHRIKLAEVKKQYLLPYSFLVRRWYRRVHETRSRHWPSIPYLSCCPGCPILFYHFQNRLSSTFHQQWNNRPCSLSINLLFTFWKRSLPSFIWLLTSRFTPFQYCPMAICWFETNK